MPIYLCAGAPRRRICLLLAAAAGYLLATPAPLLAAPASGAMYADAYAPHITEAAHRFGIPESWIRAVMHTESAGSPVARSPKGAMGLMQIMPATWTMLSDRYDLGPDPFEVRANIHAGAAYLRMMWDRYGNVAAMLAAYNAGPARADAYVAGRSSLPGETTAYVARIAPAIGGFDATSAVATNAARPMNWRQASLFTQSTEGARSRSPAVVDTQRKTQPPIEPHDELAQAAIPTSGLFVPLSGPYRP